MEKKQERSLPVWRDKNEQMAEGKILGTATSLHGPGEVLLCNGHLFLLPNAGLVKIDTVRIAPAFAVVSEGLMFCLRACSVLLFAKSEKSQKEKASHSKKSRLAL